MFFYYKKCIIINMDNLDSLFNKKEYELILDLTKDSKDAKECLMRISCLIMLGKVDQALDEIEKNQSIIEKTFQLRLMKAHFELLLSKKLFDEAHLALKHYENLPYVSQEAEEFMREMKDRIVDESHPKNHKLFELDEIYDILEKDTDQSKISQVLFSLKNYNINIYIDSLKIFMLRDDVNPNFRTYALILLIDEKINDEIKFKTRGKTMVVNPSKLEPPFVSKYFSETCEKIVKKCNNDVSLTETALHLFNCYIIDTYPDNIYEAGSDKLSAAFTIIAREYLNQKTDDFTTEELGFAHEIREIIESTPEIRL